VGDASLTREPDPLECGVGCGGVATSSPGGEAQVLPGGEIVVAVGLVSDERELSPDGAPVVREVASEHLSFPRVKRQKPGNEPQHRGLARAVGTGEQDDLALGNVEIDAGEGRVPPEEAHGGAQTYDEHNGPPDLREAASSVRSRSRHGRSVPEVIAQAVTSLTSMSALSRVRPVLASAGRILVTAGILILLFVAYQLWGTGLYEGRAQRELRSDFEEQLDRRTVAASRQPEVPSSPEDTASSPDESAANPLPPPPIPPAGEPVGIIRIPKLGLDKVVVEGTSVADLRKGPGHYIGTPIPGQFGNAAIAGHRTTYGAPFGDLDLLEPNDVITFVSLAGTFDYAVREKLVVAPTQVDVLDPPPDPTKEAELTLTTCNPKYSARERLVVTADFRPRPDQEPQQPEPRELRRPKSIDGLSGERDSRLPAVVFGLVTATVGLLWWLVFHRYRGWITWLAGAVPFAAALFVFYTYFERVLPSNY
jgi:sortase A